VQHVRKDPDPLNNTIDLFRRRTVNGLEYWQQSLSLALPAKNLSALACAIIRNHSVVGVYRTRLLTRRLTTAAGDRMPAMAAAP